MSVDEERKEALLSEIREAFANVNRDGGISWSESIVLDDQGSDKERAQARALDNDKTWQEVADDSAWRHDMGVGGFSFLDPIGFRYYLPAKMTVFVLTPNGDFDDFEFHLTLKNRDLLGLRTHSLQQWSLLSTAQKLCVRHFLEYMRDTLRRMQKESNSRYDGGEVWEKALNSYWKDIS